MGVDGMSSAYAERSIRNDVFRAAYSSGTAPADGSGGHDGGMAGLEGMEQPRGHGRAAAARWSPAVEDERALKALELFGNPTEAEVQLPSLPESAASARRLAQVVILRQWGLSPKMTEDAVLLVSELVGNAVRHTGARVFGLRMRRRRGWIRVSRADGPATIEVYQGLGELVARTTSRAAGAVPARVVAGGFTIVRR